MKTFIKCSIIVLTALFVFACDISTSHSNNSNNQPDDYSNKVEEKMNDKEFACGYRFISEVCQADLNESIGWRSDINYTDKIYFGYINKIKDGYDKCLSDNAGQVKVHIALDRNYRELTDEWLASDNLSYLELEEMKEEYQQLIDSNELEKASNLRQEIYEYEHQIGLSINNGYSNLLLPYLNDQFHFDVGYFVGTFSDLDECNEYMEALNQISSFDFVFQVSVVYDFGELVSKELYFSYFEEYYAELKRLAEENGGSFNIDHYGEDVHYIPISFVFVKDEPWVAWFFCDTNKLRYFVPIA